MPHGLGVRAGTVAGDDGRAGGVAGHTRPRPPARGHACAAGGPVWRIRSSTIADGFGLVGTVQSTVRRCRRNCRMWCHGCHGGQTGTDCDRCCCCCCCVRACVLRVLAQARRRQPDRGLRSDRHSCARAAAVAGEGDARARTHVWWAAAHRRVLANQLSAPCCGATVGGSGSPAAVAVSPSGRGGRRPAAAQRGAARDCGRRQPACRPTGRGAIPVPAPILASRWFGACACRAPLAGDADEAASRCATAWERPQDLASACCSPPRRARRQAG